MKTTLIITETIHFILMIVFIIATAKAILDEDCDKAVLLARICFALYFGFIFYISNTSLNIINLLLP